MKETNTINGDDDDDDDDDDSAPDTCWLDPSGTYATFVDGNPSNTESVSEEENLCRYALSEVMSPSSEASTSDSERERCQSPCVLNDQICCAHYAITRFITTSIPTTSHVRCHVMKRTPQIQSSQ